MEACEACKEESAKLVRCEECRRLCCNACRRWVTVSFTGPTHDPTPLPDIAYSCPFCDPEHPAYGYDEVSF